MSRQLLSHSPDLTRLVEEGYEVSFESGLLLLGVPYLDAQGAIQWGRLTSALETQTSPQERTASPVGDHTVHFIGASGEAQDRPYDRHGNVMTDLMNQPNGPLNIGSGLIASCQMSQKPVGEVKYVDYFEKMTTYASMLLVEVHSVDPEISLRTHKPMATLEDESVHRYFDSATSRARIGAVMDKTVGQRIAIVGLGGTGSYILDALAKTHVAEIHLFDGDIFKPHNAFRAPGAVSLEQLQAQPSKVAYHQSVYDAMHRQVVPHETHIDGNNVAELGGFDFVFISIDAGPVKQVIVDELKRTKTPFVDTGMGVDQTGESLGGILRTTLVTWTREGELVHLEEGLLSVADDDEGYEQNIQIAELNMLNAAHAIIAWKKHIGFYRDYGHEMASAYTLDGNRIMNSGSGDED